MSMQSSTAGSGWPGLSLILLLAGTGEVLAHHSAAPHFDMRNPIEFSGTITRFEARNPHSFLYVDGADGRQWKCEFNGIAMLVRAGIDRSTFRNGEQVRVEAYPGRRVETDCYFLAAHTSDGRTIRVAPEPIRQAAPVTAAASENSIFGVWVAIGGALPPAQQSAASGRAAAAPVPAPGRANVGPSMYESLTPAGKAAIAGYDAIRDDPARNCSPIGPVRVWGTPNHPTEIVNQGDRILIRHEYMDVERIVDMRTRVHPANGPRTVMGHSVGWFEGDTLVIDTANFTPGLNVQYAQDSQGNYTGIMRSDAYHVIERLRVDPADGNLQLVTIQQDPKFLTRTFTSAPREFRRRSDLSLSRYNCEPDRD